MPSAKSTKGKSRKKSTPSLSSKAAPVPKAPRIDTRFQKALLEQCLGQDAERYWRVVKDFLCAQISKIELDTAVMDILGAEHVYLHNEFFMSLIHNASSADLPPKPLLTRTNSILSYGNGSDSIGNGSHGHSNRVGNNEKGGSKKAKSKASPVTSSSKGRSKEAANRKYSSSSVRSGGRGGEDGDASPRTGGKHSEHKAKETPEEAERREKTEREKERQLQCERERAKQSQRYSIYAHMQIDKESLHKNMRHVGEYKDYQRELNSRGVDEYQKLTRGHLAVSLPGHHPLPAKQVCVRSCMGLHVFACHRVRLYVYWVRLCTVLKEYIDM